MSKKEFQRLPKTVVPKHYALTLTPNLKEFTFDGKVDINIEVVIPTNTIVLNSLDLNLKEVTIKTADNTNVTDITTKTFKEDEKAEFTLPQSLPVGNHFLTIKFTGELNDKMMGFYRSKYKNPLGEDRYAAVTDFEPTNARRCFPCWDEPALKATFDVSLIVPSELVSVSNMPVKNQIQIEDLIRHEYEITPIMSTYLVAVVIGEYDYVEDRSTDGIIVRVYTPEGKKEQGLFALGVATKVLPFYKQYFNVAYPLPKMDLITIADYPQGAMENWGLVTFREDRLLVDPENTSAKEKQAIALVVGHEIAHQWFGNLVTMEWWTHLWLNEGFATFAENLCVDHVFPEYNIWNQFVTEMYFAALELDGLENTHPIEVPVEHPSEIAEIFDKISYCKGASVIRMLHNYIGDDDFRKGMNLYLTKHQYQNTSTEDLWAAMEESSKKPIRSFMSTWTKIKGFPVVTACLCQSNEDDCKLNLTQSKFTTYKKETEFHELWMIPITVTTQRDPTKIVVTEMIMSTHSAIQLPNVGMNDWVKINLGTVGFYRTKYPNYMLARFIPAIRDKILPPLDRLGLVDDLFALVETGHTSTVEALTFMQAFIQEDNFAVWLTIGKFLGKVDLLLSHTDYEDTFKKYKRRLLTNIFKRLGWEPLPNETHLNTLLRNLILSLMISLDDSEVIMEARTRFEKHIKEGPSMSADLRDVCYKMVLRAGDQETYDEMVTLYNSVDFQEEKRRVQIALCAIRDKELLSQTLQFSISENVRAQDSIAMIISVSCNSLGRDLAWQFIKDNWAELTSRYEEGFKLASLVKNMAVNFATEEMAQEIEAFFKQNKTPGTDRAIMQALESIRRTAEWLQRDNDAIKEFLISPN